jgi:hypothetical protein
MPLLKFLRAIRQTRDGLAAGLTLLVTLVSVWLLALPISPMVQSASLERFHLQTPSFSQWAVQQPIPSMYNFENRYWTYHQPLDRQQLEDTPPRIETSMINHFPGRVYTFANNRYRLLHARQPGYLYMRSRYRGRDIWTAWLAVPSPRGGMRLIRTEPPDAQ